MLDVFVAMFAVLVEILVVLPSSQAGEIRNSNISEELALPPVKIHCSVLAEDAIKAAIVNYKSKQ